MYNSMIIRCVYVCVCLCVWVWVCVFEALPLYWQVSGDRQAMSLAVSWLSIGAVTLFTTLP